MPTPNYRGWRNMFITLSTLGLINKGNNLTESGNKLSHLSYAEFALKIFKYLEPFFEILITTLQKNAKKQQININNQDLFKIIRKENGEVSYLTEYQAKNKQANTRYISSYLNILKDDYGVVDFEPRKSHRTLLCNPFALNEKAFKEHIQAHSHYKQYQADFERLCSEI